MDSAEWRPILSSLVLPPTGPLLLALVGWLIARRWRGAGRAIGLAGWAALWLLCCNGTAIWMSHTLLPPVQHLAPATVAQQLTHEKVQAIVVLGGGVYRHVPEFDGPLPGSITAARVQYGAWLSRQSGLPLAFAGGLGWANAGIADHPSEAASIRAVLERAGAPTPRWLDDRSRDTAENGLNMARQLRPEGIVRVALVTHAWHMPRAVRAFEAAGLTVLPAPMGFIVPHQRPLLEWMPSSYGLDASHQVLREWLAWRMGR